MLHHASKIASNATAPAGRSAAKFVMVEADEKTSVGGGVDEGENCSSRQCLCYIGVLFSLEDFVEPHLCSGSRRAALGTGKGFYSSNGGGCLVGRSAHHL